MANDMLFLLLTENRDRTSLLMYFYCQYIFNKSFMFQSNGKQWPLKLPLHNRKPISFPLLLEMQVNSGIVQPFIYNFEKV